MPEFPMREVIREADFEEQVAALIPDIEKADLFMAAAEELLAREPRDGLPASKDGSVWYLPMSPIRGKTVALYYTFDVTAVTLIAITAE
jgi:hypothetical protein